MTRLTLRAPALPLMPRLLPGLGLAALIAMAAMAVQRASGIGALSPMVLAMLAGIALRNTRGVAPAFGPGIAFALRPVLRAGIVLLGFRLTFTQVAEVGGPGLAVIVAVLIGTFVFTKAAGRLLGVEARLAELIAAGSAVCGASAVLAVNTVTRARDADVAYAIACVTVFGTLSMLGFPLLASALQMSDTQLGLWAGASIHEVAQVIGAAFAKSDIAGQAGTVAKLSRVMMLAPLILSLGAFARRRGAEAGRAPMPLFVLGFVAAVAINSTGALPDSLQPLIATTASFFLTTALAAMGLEIDLGQLRLKGLRPLILGALAWVFVSALGLGLVLAL
ncbi:YeiH family protein [Pseudothioclava arenosa]|uniref:YeiH family putative sulfate export transporter n=1 Tax=Pseudothioclava arenosa TaxID=1795308 RepID=A0A2A4CNE8_9RHOB|nr:YeiH family protein [Pseudothioclava arenosa]PCD75808.1 YeiH family putative sulfate export transporter [Pseudothioclava arenosa]